MEGEDSRGQSQGGGQGEGEGEAQVQYGAQLMQACQQIFASIGAGRGSRWGGPGVRDSRWGRGSRQYCLTAASLCPVVSSAAATPYCCLR